MVKTEWHCEFIELNVPLCEGRSIVNPSRMPTASLSSMAKTVPLPCVCSRPCPQAGSAAELLSDLEVHTLEHREVVRRRTGWSNPFQ